MTASYGEMDNPISPEAIRESLIEVRGHQVLLDSEVASIYGVHTRDVNKAIKNNQEKFPEGYVIQLSSDEKCELVENFHQFNRLKHSRYPPTAFTERGLYMLATILKSKRATEATIHIIEAFAKLRELANAMASIPESTDKASRAGQLATELFDDHLQVTDSETSLEINFAVLKVRHKIHRKQG